MASKAKPTMNGRSNGSTPPNKPGGGSSSSSAAAPLSLTALGYMFLLALQFGMQPALTRRYTPPTVCRTTIVLAQECVKFCLAVFMLVSAGQMKSAFEGWSLYSWITVAAVPASLYVVQNLSALMAYQNLDPITFNVLNQTKTLSAALCCYLIIGRKQSPVQVASLFLLLLSALVIEKIVTPDLLLSPFVGGSSDDESGKEDTGTEKMGPGHFTYGVVPVLTASFISGLAGAISQKNLQGSGGRNAVFFSAEMCVASVILLLGSLLFNDDGRRIASDGFFRDWTPQTLIPILTNASGGIIVGLVTKYAGSVRKGFALIFGMLLSGVIQAATSEKSEVGPGGTWAISREEIAGGILASLSLWMHSTHPYKPPVGSSVMNGPSKGVVANGAPTATTKRGGRKSRKED